MLPPNVGKYTRYHLPGQLEGSMAESLLDLILQAKHCVALTGAGISTLSGIPDFRGVGGLYNRTDIDASKLFDINYFLRDPSYYYKHSKDFLYSLDDKSPSLVHECLAGLENKGLLKAVITQNVDLLHQRAGSQVVFELHGSPRRHRCLDCGEEYGFTEIARRVNEGEVPFCGLCGGTIKPDIVFFGEMLPSYDLENASRQARQADLMLVLGTSLTVYPAAALPEETLAGRGKLAIVNAGPTHMDKRAIWRGTDLSAVFAPIQEYLHS